MSVLFYYIILYIAPINIASACHCIAHILLYNIYRHILKNLVEYAFNMEFINISFF